MKTSLSERNQMDDYLMHRMNAEDLCLFQAKLILQPELNEQLFWEQESLEVIRQYGRRQLKLKIERLQNEIFHQAKYEGFRNKILLLFNADK